MLAPPPPHKGLFPLISGNQEKTKHALHLIQLFYSSKILQSILSNILSKSEPQI